jgi:hypothetical protein
MSKILTNSATPALIRSNLISDEEQYDYGQIVKGIVHAWIIPFIIAFIDPAYSLVYIACAGFLYSTVFRDKSDGFFGAVVFSMLIIAMMVIPS